VRDRDHLWKLGDTLRKAEAFLGHYRATKENAERQGVFHLGEAGGIAFQSGVRGIESDAFFQDMSDAVETWDMDRVRKLQRHVWELEKPATSRSRRSGRDREVDSVPWECDWLQYGAAANEAKEALEVGDSHRFALMCGFLVGMMWRYPGPHRRRRDFEEWVRATADDNAKLPPNTTYQGGTVADTVMDGFREERLDLLCWAVGRIGVGQRFSSYFPSERDELRAYLEREGLSVEYAQNFGLRIARADDDSLRVPHSYAIQRTAVLSATEEGNQADNGTDEDE